MTRPTMVIGLLVSLVLHALVLAIPARPAPPASQTPQALPVEVVETELPEPVREDESVPVPEPGVLAPLGVLGATGRRRRRVI